MSEGTPRGSADRPMWLRSSHCEATTCVEIARQGGGAVAVRDAKAPEGAVLVFTPAEWDAFVAGVKAGEFDAL